MESEHFMVSKQWAYSIPKEYDVISQEDWNQSLTTKINQILIENITTVELIKIPSNILPIIKTLLCYNSNKNTFDSYFTRFEHPIVIDETLGNKIQIGDNFIEVTDYN
jgi:hypothetical protein